jgi:hypothetical protein
MHRWLPEPRASSFVFPRAASGCQSANPGLAGALIPRAAASRPHEAATNSVRAAVDALATTSSTSGASVGWRSHAVGFGTYLAAAHQSIIGSPSISSELSWSWEYNMGRARACSSGNTVSAHRIDPRACFAAWVESAVACRRNTACFLHVACTVQALMPAGHGWITMDRGWQ